VLTALRRYSIGAVGLLIGTTMVAAQQPTAPQPPSFTELARQVDTQVDSSDPLDVAWGAYHAGVYHLTSAIPRLTRILESPPAMDARERRALLDVVLDTLIQLKARLPATLLVDYANEWPVHTFALLARASDRTAVLLDLLVKSSGFQWYSAANMLLEDRAPGLAAHLLSTLHLHVTVTVHDSDLRSFAGSIGSSIGVGDGIGQTPPAYPPHAEYRFEIASRPGVFVLAAGPHTVYYSRTITTEFQYGSSELRISGPSDADRIAYVRAMLGPGNNTMLRADSHESVQWTTAEALIHRIEELRREIERQYRTMLGGLVERNLVTADVGASLSPQIDLQLFDRRRNPDVALPTIR
jgi:hypothetical protein